ncbi:hypothetical protein E0500_005215 [Streptomyces sp. KM273126]|uniref:hypothetical protein n=1 Tax=Streptomyces sp. KM273126 TaxID=2545247 RepID=UPI00103F901C|nr:hypothetical protein [Streptomyces sp. KM273126]MBA2806863.1 hypothetical protein [Streptomyces sp. KM273126]
MSTWLIIAEETVTADEATSRRQAKLVRSLNGNKTREEALVELHKEAKNYTSDSLKRASTVVGRDSDGSFWVLPKNGTGHASCNLLLIEQIRS